MKKITFQKKWANNLTYHGPNGCTFGPSPLLARDLWYLAYTGPNWPSLIALSITILPQELYIFLFLSLPNNQPSSRHQTPYFYCFRPLGHPLSPLQHWVSVSGRYHRPCHLQAAPSSSGGDEWWKRWCQESSFQPKDQIPTKSAPCLPNCHPSLLFGFPSMIHTFGCWYQASRKSSAFPFAAIVGSDYVEPGYMERKYCHSLPSYLPSAQFVVF